jgi:carnosine N-methyltransferase
MSTSTSPSKSVTDTTSSRAEMDERVHFNNVVSAFKCYKRDSLERIKKTHGHVKKLSLEQQRMLDRQGYQDSLKALESCVELNYAVVQQIIADVSKLFDNAQFDVGTGSEDGSGGGGGGDLKAAVVTRTQVDDMEKVQSTMKQFVRDWSAEGEQERNMCYRPILKELARIYGGEDDVERRRADVKVLVPGAGMGRLAFDIAHMGFESEGNEFSLFMLLASNFVLNKCKTVNSVKIYPWIHQFTNNMRTEDMVRHVSFPDVDANDLPEDSKFTMAAGDFLEVYSDKEYAGAFDCVATCFFIDCAHNICDFIELIYKILKPGGRWINLGPLLYHFSDVPRQASIEPSYDIVKGLIEQTGFRFEREKTNVLATYCQNPASMLQYQYKCVFFTCVKE